ncbi:hypothetical protein MMPV_003504 [Pyropia vietnamensis]
MAFVGSSAFLGDTALRPRSSAVCTVPPPVGGLQMVDSLPPAPLKYDAVFSPDPSAARPKDVAPMITLSFATPASDLDGTAKVGLSMKPVGLDTATAQTILGNMALFAALKSRTRLATSAAVAAVRESPTGPAGGTPKDVYFPMSTRNQAPVISFGKDNDSISVAYTAINPVVGGVAANSADGVAFWKNKTYKYEAPATPDAAPAPEVLSTAAYERYFPTKIRNRAPVISMRPPAGPWDTTAYLTVGSEVVQLNASAARQLTVDKPAEDAANVRGSVVAEKNFGGDRANVAPVIEIGEESVSVAMQAVAVGEDAAASVAANASA